MSKSPKKENEVKQEASKLDAIKNVARAFNKHMNHQYQKAVSYVPDVETVAKVTVSKWLEMPKAFQDAVGLPGLPIGNITHVYGKSNSGKTTLLMQGIAQAQKQGVLPILILTEHKFDFYRLSDWMDADPEAMLVFHADSIEEAYGYIEKVLREVASGKLVIEDEAGKDIEIDIANQDCFIFMDSIGNTMSESELEYEVENHDKSMGKAAKALKTLTRRVNGLLGKVRQKCGILLLNQSYMSMPSYGPSVETPYGGEGIIYSCVLNIRLRRVKDLSMTIKGQDSVIGLETKVEVKKNHITHLMPISTVYVTAKGMIEPTKEALDSFKKELK